MIVHQIYALIGSGGVVKTVAICDNYEEANRVARGVYGDNAIAVDCLQYPCGPGDIYRDGFFWRINNDGTESQIKYVPTEAQKIQTLDGQNTELQTALVEQYEINLELNAEVTNTQIAIADLYETGGLT